MKKTGISFLAQACSGQLLGAKDTIISDVVIDSRAAHEGAMFVCIVGEKNDGHKFWEKAYEAGCRAFLMSDASTAEKASERASVILVNNTEDAFVLAASAYIAQFDLFKIGVTGSVGKTSTKMLTAAVLSAKYRTVCTRKNLNTQLGLCLTCFLADETTEAIVFEMGMDHKGEIDGYCRWIRPDAALITMIGISHMEFLGSRSAICDAKLEITNYLSEDAPLFYNEDGEYLYESEIRRRTSGRFACCPVLGQNGRLQCRNEESLGANGIRFTLVSENEEQEFRLPMLGLHNAGNAALACAVGLHYGISLSMAAEALSRVESSDGRLKSENLNGIFLIDDSYNAAPDSMVAALDVLSAIECDRRIAVISDMRELGSDEAEGHRRVGRRAAELKIDCLLIVGEKKDYYLEGINTIGFEGDYCGTFDTAEEASAMLCNILKKGDAVLIKGSNATRISSVAKAVKEAYSK